MAKKIKIAIVGIGNCASSLIQGIYYSKNKNNLPGVLYDDIGDYKIKDIEVVAAFDIDERKVGKDVSQAIFQKPNNTRVFFDKIPLSGVKVLRGPTLDGNPKIMDNFPEEIRFKESKIKPVNVTEVLIKTKPDLLINYLPVGSEKATKYYVNSCLKAGVSFINAIPVFICSNKKYSKMFEDRGLVCLGDDIKAQVGATIVHRVLTNLFKERGVELKRTYQINFGGNTDFLNMLERGRLKSKKTSKTEAVRSQLENPLREEDIHIGPSDFIPWLKDNKVCHIRMEGEQFGGTPIKLDLKLSVEDSPNSAGVMVDTIRCAKLALDRKLKGYLDEVSSFAFKHPINQYTDDMAYKLVKEFIYNEK
ncbi:MAG TPA: inositol-3-phosphate synthase [Candidatus Pacearchaeota archaeon]|nr:inositol-3-phosphate synthase [Candidatus Pacearchaeota archaeon]HQI57585.1 inositol-3-phosphate synthase [Candidatus Pacearchaeota archaeon]HQJ58140.1 inositol-3-phosphate synthase [Candidatus Pacearchaeota archaeon]